MSYKSIIQILLILAIISTLCISIMKPKMHEPVMVMNSQFNVQNDDSIKIDEQNISLLVQETDIKQGNFKSENQNRVDFVESKPENTKPLIITQNPVKTQNTENIQNKINQQKNTKGVKNTETDIKSQPVKAKNNSIKPRQTETNSTKITSNQPPKIDLNKIVNNNQKIVNTPSKTQTMPAQTNDISVANIAVQTKKTEQKTTQASRMPENPTSVQTSSQITTIPKQITSTTEKSPVILTAAQEEIAWNKWRSNLNNQIMKDAKLPTMPNGIIFKYKFTVDKYGKVSNVQTSSTTSGYTPYAIQFIAPVIRSYQGRAILNFPEGSKREYTEVSGAWKISNNSKLSTPDDYHDIEKIKR